MSQQAVISLPLSRPKVHRLPKVSRPASKKIQPVLASVAALLTVSVVVVAANKLTFKENSDIPDMMPVTADLSNPTPPAKDSSTIVIQGDKQAIVGQMAKIPSQNQQITEIKSVSNVDNGNGRELLSIVGKY